MLHLVQSNKMECLAARLVEWMGRSEADPLNPFEPEQILVQSPGMAQWLKLKIAESTGIAANLAFPLPSSFIWALYQTHLPDLPAQSAFTKPNMTWKLMAILPGLLDEPGFEALKTYLEDEHPLKRFQLCHKIADVFDQYLVYRPDWIETWESGRDDLSDAQVAKHPWQPILWRALTTKSVALGESPYHRANLHQALLDALSQAPSKKSKPLYLFGLSAIPQQQLEVFARLAQHRDVVIFWANPSEHYWGDIVDDKTLAKSMLEDGDELAPYLEVGNPLLGSWGKLGRDYQEMLLALELEQVDDFIELEPTSLLEHIQGEIQALCYRGSQDRLSADELLSNGNLYPKIPLLKQDDSLCVHICHSKVRELEVLHDHLLHCFRTDPQLTPGDIIVMMPDVAQYAPYIEGVFGSAEQDLSIPYAISDRNLVQESGVISSFLSLMNLHQSRFTLNDVLGILEVPAVLRKFDIQLAEFELLKHWLSEAEIRWGWDAQDKQRWDLPAEGQNTWQFGLDRLFSGFAMAGESIYRSSRGQIAPFEDIEGQQAAALGKFYLFAQVLTDCLQYCQHSQSIQHKVEGALAFLERIFEVEEEEQVWLNELRQALEQINLHTDQYTDLIDQDIFVCELNSKLQDKGVGQRFLAGYVNFCTLMPMRSIPFQRVCVLGMNEGEYPRQTLPLGFDLMQDAKPRKGDRSRRQDDRYLFLEAILSARQQVYISYQGFSQRDNSPRPASILLSELLEYCEYCFCMDGDQDQPQEQTRERLKHHLVTHHPLQPFSPDYFNGTLSGSFQAKWLSVLSRPLEQHLEQGFVAEPLQEIAVDPLEEAIELSQLLSFFRHPTRQFFQQRWQTSLQLRFEEIKQEEPFALDPLERYQLMQRLIEQPDGARLRFQSEGALPVGNPGGYAFTGVEQLTSPISQSLERLRDGQSAKRVEIDLKLAEQRLQGWVDDLYSERLVMWRPGKVRVQDRIVLWLNWLSVCASCDGAFKHAHFIGTKESFKVAALPAEQAKAQLMTFVDVWRQGMNKPVLLFPETAWNWLKWGDKDKALRAYMGTEAFPGEGGEPHNARVSPDLNEQFDEFAEVSERLLRPLFDACGEQ